VRRFRQCSLTALDSEDTNMSKPKCIEPERIDVTGNEIAIVWTIKNISPAMVEVAQALAKRANKPLGKWLSDLIEREAGSANP
jgi:hypothetical protein